MMNASSRNNVDKRSILPSLVAGPNGVPFAKWQEHLILAFANSSANGVAQNAEGLLTNPEAFNKEIAEARIAGTMDTNSINKIVALRNSASITMFTQIPSCLDTDTRMSLDVDEEYKRLKVPQLAKDVFGLIGVIKRLLSVGIKGDPLHQTMKNIKELHAITQGPVESVKVYVQKFKAASDLFNITDPLGTIFNEPELGFVMSGNSKEEIKPLKEKFIKKSKPAQGWLNEKYLVRLAINGLDTRYNKAKWDWQAAMIDIRGQHASIPDTLDGLTERIVQLELMHASNVINSNSNSVPATPNVPTASHFTKRTVKAARPGMKDPPKCLNCGKLGHKAEACWTPKKEGSEQGSRPNDRSRGGRGFQRGGRGTGRGGRGSGRETGNLNAKSFMTAAVSQVASMSPLMNQYSFSMMTMTMSSSRESTDRNVIFVDNCSQISVFRDRSLLVEVVPIEPIIMNIVGTFSNTAVTHNEKGYFLFHGSRHEVLVDTNAKANILSQSAWEEDLIAAKLSLSKPARLAGDTRKIAGEIKDMHNVLVGILSADTLMSTLVDVHAWSMWTTYGQQASRADQEVALKARALQDRLGFASATAVKRMISRETIMTDVRQRDIDLATELIGGNLTQAAGKTVRKRTKLIRHTVEVESCKQQSIHADVFYVCGKGFVLAIVEPMHYMMVEHLRNDASHSTAEIVESLLKMKAYLSDRSYEVTEIHFDSEARHGAFTGLPGLVVHPPGTHVGRAERAIRTIKETIRCYCCQRPWFPWIGRMMVELVATAVTMINLRSPGKTESRQSPFQQFSGRTPDAVRDFPASFGDLVAYEAIVDKAADKSDVTRNRVKVGIWLRPAFDDHASSIIMDIYNYKITRSCHVTVISWTPEHQDKLVSLYNFAGAPRTSTVDFVAGGVTQDLLTCNPIADAELDDTEYIFGNTEAIRQDIDTFLNAARVEAVANPRVIDEEPPKGKKRRRKRGHSSAPKTAVTSVEDAEDNPSIMISPISTEDPLPEPAFPEEDIPQTLLGRGKRTKHMTTKRMMFTDLVTHTLAKGMKQVLALKGDVKTQAHAALLKEARNLVVDHPALVAVLGADVPIEAERLPMSVFVNNKMVNGKHCEFKARIIARGDRQSVEDYAELSTHTVNTESVMLILAIAGFERRKLCVMDVKGAYLNANMQTPNDRGLYVKINADLAEVFVAVKPEWKSMRNSDGTLFLRVDRAIYGCKQSSFLWQVKLTGVLIGMGFVISPYDNCVAVKGDIIVCFHVDDLLIAAKTLRDIQNFQNEFKRHFEVKVQNGSELDYLGLHIQVRDDCIVLSQLPMVKQLVAEIHGGANSPAADIEENGVSPDANLSNPLNKVESEKYRSVVASALYLSKRTRPDILLAVNKLTRHSHCPTVADGLALNRLLRYLSKTRDNVLVLHTTSLIIEAYIDASWAMDEGRKSTTGALIMVGGSLIWGKSSKQSIVTKSSFEAELVALSDMASMVLWVHMFLGSLGYYTDVPVIYQDNQSTIRVATKGLSSNINTKHIDIRYMWVKEMYEKERLCIEFKKTDEMIADGCTKPLTGEKFYRYVQDLNVRSIKQV